MTEQSRYIQGGLEPRFVIERADGRPIKSTRRYGLVLDFSGTDPHARVAAMAYADSVREENPQLADDIVLALQNPHLAPAQHRYDGSNPDDLVGLNDAWSKVREFHNVFGHPAPLRPQRQDVAQAKRRADWIHEEADELVEDTETLIEIDDPTECLVAQADAYIDAIYFALGGLVELGLRPAPLLNIVHEANMAKRHVINGEFVVVKNEAGKVVKPEGWEDPHPKLRAEVLRQVALAYGASSQ